MTVYLRTTESFINAYIQAMLWSTSGTDHEGNDLESLEGWELSAEAMQKVKQDCESFLIAAKDLLASLPAWYGQGDGGIYVFAGHDFWLTRNGHGVGFWDRGLGALGDSLTDLAQAYGEQSPYIGDDGKIYI